jgi:hypothetical protein
MCFILSSTPVWELAELGAALSELLSDGEACEGLRHCT